MVHGQEQRRKKAAQMTASKCTRLRQKKIEEQEEA
jgi:hypothetical protein